MRLYVHHTRRRLTGTPYSSFTYQRNPSDPIINPSPISMGRVFFNGAQTICCLKLAIAFHTQAIPDRGFNRSSLRVEHPRPNRVYCCLSSLNFVFYVTTMYTANYLPVIVVVWF